MLRERDTLLKREMSTCGLVVKRSRKQGAEAQGSIKTRGHQGSENRPSFPHKVSHLLKKFHLTALMIAYCHLRNLIRCIVVGHISCSSFKIQLKLSLLPLQASWITPLFVQEVDLAHTSITVFTVQHFSIY